MKSICSSSSQPSNLIWVFIFINLISISFADPRITEAGRLCGTKTPPPNTTNIPTFVKEMEVLSQLVNKQKWGNHSINSTPPMYGLAQCYGDLSQTDCLLCYAASRTRIPRCLPATSARIYLDGCFQRYDEYDFFHESTDPVHDSVNCSDSVGGLSRIDQTRLEFNVSVGDLIDNLTQSAVVNGGFGVAEIKGVFGLAQCWKTLSSDECRVCLEKANKDVRMCLPSNEGRGLIAGCYLRYSTKKFYSDGTVVNKHSGLSTRVTAAITSAASAFFVLLILAAYAGYVRLSKMRQGRHNLGKIPALFSKSSLNFKYETLEKATDYFNPSRKIGQGGAGSVYKGTLANGEIVAVKRLFFHTRQWVDEFFNEVNLINGIQHKNLVKLLGCSIEGPESLLVYEYVPNKSLDQFLFEKNKIQILNWNQRFDIVVGTAKGLAYLHESCHVRIIHRDIKSSNVLLDDNLNPKIADFGLARCFAADQTHLSTGIAGTLGYMAPEYLVRGQLTEKADVYSFGVLVLDIVSGRKNNVFIEESGSLLQTIWKLYKAEKLVESVDPCLKYDFPEKEANKVLQIGLLCTQASAALRPSMTEVVQMLNSKDSEIPMASQPPFLNASLLGSPNSNGYYSIKGLVSNNVLAQYEVSNTSTESTSVNSSDQPSGSEELKHELFQSNTR